MKTLTVTSVFVLLAFFAVTPALAQDDGSIVAYGYNADGQCTVPEPNAGFVAVAAGAYHSLGLTFDGTIVAWGRNSLGQCDVPLPNADFVAIAAGGYHSLGLKSDGTIVAWGWNDYGQCNVPLPNQDFVAVRAGFWHSLARRSDGTIVAWGRNDVGQCNVPAPNTDFVGVAAGWYHSLGRKSDGSVVAWGECGDGQCSVPAPNAGFAGIAGGGYHSLGLRSDGTVAAWGQNWQYGQCNVPAPNAGFAVIAAGQYHSLGLKSDHTIVAWGRNDYGQCTAPSPNAGFAGVAAGGFHSLGLKTLKLGACCDHTGLCTVVPQLNCPETSTWQGADTVCSPNPCAAPIDVEVSAGSWIDPEPWHDWVSNEGGRGITVQAHIPAHLGAITHVQFYYSTNGGASWHFIADDADGYEPPLNTVDTSVQMTGCGWSTEFVIPDTIPAGPIWFKTVAHPASGEPVEDVTVHDYDPAPPSMGSASLTDRMVIDRDALGTDIYENGTTVERIIIRRSPMEPAFAKGIPGINQSPHGTMYCAPVAAAQCLKYFEGQGDTVVTGSLETPRLVESLAAYMGTNRTVQGTLPSNWVAGMGAWIAAHGQGYTVRYYPHYECDDIGVSTWTGRDWRRIRDELELCRDVLVGVYWDGGGGHALTLNSITYPENPDGSITVGFKDPWTGATAMGDLDPASGHIANLGGAGGGGGGRIGITMIVSRKETAVGSGGAGDVVYDGPPPGRPPYHFELPFPGPGFWFIHITLVRGNGHAHRLTYVVEYDPNNTHVPEQPGAAPFALGLGSCVPNPFSVETRVSYTVPRLTRVHLAVHDVAGREVRTLVAGEVQPGQHEVVWNGRDDAGRKLSAGVYLVRISGSGATAATKLILRR